jgi:hypothetical protein
MKLWLKILILIGFLLLLLTMGLVQNRRSNQALRNQQPVPRTRVDVTTAPDIPVGSYILDEDGNLFPVNIGKRNVKAYCKAKCGTALFGKQARCRRNCKDVYI